MARSSVFVLLLVLTAFPVGVSAQAPTSDLNTSTTTIPPVTPSTNDSTAPIEPSEPIDRLTAIDSTRIENGRMVLILRSKIPQRITLTDAGAVWNGGEVPRQSYTLQPGTNRVSIPVTEVSGRVAVTIATRRVLYATTITTGRPLLTGPFGRDDVRTAALAGLVAGIGVTGLIAYRRVKGTADAPERLL